MDRAEYRSWMESTRDLYVRCAGSYLGSYRGLWPNSSRFHKINQVMIVLKLGSDGYLLHRLSLLLQFIIKLIIPSLDSVTYVQSELPTDMLMKIWINRKVVNDVDLKWHFPSARWTCYRYMHMLGVCVHLQNIFEF